MYREVLVLLCRSQKKRWGDNGRAEFATPFLFAAVLCLHVFTLTLIAEGITHTPLFLGRSRLAMIGVLFVFFVAHFVLLRREIDADSNGADASQSRSRAS